MAKEYWPVIEQTTATAKEVLATLGGDGTKQMVAGLAAKVKDVHDRGRIEPLVSP